MSWNAPPQANDLSQHHHQQQQHHHQQQQFRQQRESRPAPHQPGAQPVFAPQHIAQLQQHQNQHQQPTPQHQGHAAMNGMNGGNMAAAGGMPVPTPAGHQAELNYIYGMVEELSRQLADNRRVTEDIVNGLGRVRTRARNQGLNNDEVIQSVAEEFNDQEQSLDETISMLSESLEKAKHSRDANANLLSQYANVLALMLKQFHEYKAKHVADVTAWHRSYRAQLDEARRENCRLREQVWEMQDHAARANDSLRAFRRRYDEDEGRWDRRVDGVAVRQELRFWKRMAMPELEDDDTYWSGDDDLIDPVEKERLRELEQRAVQEQMMDHEQVDMGFDPDDRGESQQGAFQHMGVMGGIAMQREDTGHQGLPTPPPRPLSAASSTGSTGPS